MDNQLTTVFIIDDNIKNLQEKLNELIDQDYDIINLDLTNSDSVDSAALTQILLYKKLFARGRAFNAVIPERIGPRSAPG